jgi:hypothetical protein
MLFDVQDILGGIEFDFHVNYCTYKNKNVKRIDTRSFRGIIRTSPETGIGIGLPIVLADAPPSLRQGGIFSSATWLVFGGPCGASSDAPVPVPGRPTRTVCLPIGLGEQKTKTVLESYHV